MVMSLWLHFLDHPIGATAATVFATVTNEHCREETFKRFVAFLTRGIF